MSLRLDYCYFSHGVIYQSMLKKNADSAEATQQNGFLTVTFGR
ncbi:MAG: hypothetical protein WBQ10_24600 [Terriglobales bacterium]